MQTIKVVAKAYLHMQNFKTIFPVLTCSHVFHFAVCTVVLISYRKVVKGLMLKADRGQFPTDRDVDLPHGVRRGPCTKTVSHLYVKIGYIQTVQTEICVPELLSHLYKDIRVQKAVL